MLGQWRGRKGLTLEDLPPDLDLRSARMPLASAVAVAAGVFGADACAAAA